MKFLAIEFFPLMLIPSFILLYLILTNKSQIERLFDSKVLQKLKIDQGLSKQLRITLLFLAFFFMIVAMARPVYQKGVVEVQSYQGEVVIALDISRSMKATDYYPNRLIFAKKKIEEILQKASHLSIGLIAFAKDAYIVSPITDDKEALKFLLKRLDTSMLSMRGTNILAALKSAQLLLKRAKSKNVLLITDGGDEQDFKEEIAFAKEHGMRVFILAVATQKGSPILERGEYLKDKKGDIVITKINPYIKKLADATGGAFWQARLDQKDIEQFLSKIAPQKKSLKVKKVVDRIEFYPYFVGLALLFLFLSFFDLPSKKIAFVFVGLLAMKIHAGLLDFKTIEEAKDAYKRQNYKEAAQDFEEVIKLKHSAQSYYDAANAYYKLKKYKKAIEYYNKVTTNDKELEFRKLHNLGNSYFQLHQFKKAIEMYEKALHIKEDKDTRFNLELAKKMLKKQKQSQQNQQQKNKKKKQNQKQQKQQQNQQKKSQQKQEKSKQKSKPKPSEQGEKRESKSMSDREEKKWLKLIQKNSAPTLLFKAPIKVEKKESNENPW